MRTARTRKKSFAWGGTVLLVTALAAGAAGANAEPSDPATTHAEEGAEEIRLDVPTSTAFDPLSEVSGTQAPAVDQGPVGPWTDLPDFPLPGFDNRIGLSYVMGGADGTEVSDLMLYRNPATGEWDDWGQRLSGPRQAPAIANFMGGEMLMAGGWDANGEPSTSAHYHDDGMVDP